MHRRQRRSSIENPTTMWENHPARLIGGGLTSNLHVGKVWRVWTDGLSVSAASTAETVAFLRDEYSRLRPRGGTPVRLTRRLTAAVAASALVMTAVAGCDSDSTSG